MKATLSAILILICIQPEAEAQFIKMEKLKRVEMTTEVEAFTVGKRERRHLLTNTVPVTFARLEKVDENWQIGNEIAVGAAYLYMWADVVPLSESVATVDPRAFLGVSLNVGIAQAEEGVDPTVRPGLIFGLGNFSMSLAWDFVAERRVLGVGTKIEVFTVTDALTYVFKK